MRTLLALALCATAAHAENPVELGAVEWTTDLSAAQEVSAETGRPVFVLFQEVPGCQGCQEFGSGPLEHPLLVEAIETLFVPVSVNNRGNTAKDKELLARFEEPYLNYPVVRFLDADAIDVIERKDRVYSNGALSARMIEALEQRDAEVPEYLRLFALEHSDRAHAQATFQMHCYWEGEAALGAIRGVVTTRSGWANGAEVVSVTYNPTVIDEKALYTVADRSECSVVTVPTENVRDAKASDQTFALRRTEYRYVPMTLAQRTKVNSAIRLRVDPDVYLSPRQLELLEHVRTARTNNPRSLESLDGVPEPEAWTAHLERLEKLLAG